MGLNKLRKDIRAVSPVIAIILMVAITVVLASVLYVWVMRIAEPTGPMVEFPTTEIELKHGSNDGDIVTIKHIGGDPIKWEDYKIIITNNSDQTQVAVMEYLSGKLSSGETSIFTESTTGFDNVDYQKGESYRLEVYNTKHSKQVFDKDSLICQ
jgi:flagellin-like protein